MFVGGSNVRPGGQLQDCRSFWPALGTMPDEQDLDPLLDLVDGDLGRVSNSQFSPTFDTADSPDTRIEG